MDNPKKDEILRACLHEFAEHGYEKANTNRISEQAGVSKGLIFHYFGTKQQLFLLTVERCIDELLSHFEDFNVDGLGFIDAALAYARIKANFFVENPEQYKVITQAFVQPPSALRTELLQRYAKLRTVGMQIMYKLIAELQLRPGISRERVIELITMVLSSLENRYVPILSQDAHYSEALIQKITQDYTELMEMVLYGIAEQS